MYKEHQRKLQYRSPDETQIVNILNGGVTQYCIFVKNGSFCLNYDCDVG